MVPGILQYRGPVEALRRRQRVSNKYWARHGRHSGNKRRQAASGWMAKEQLKSTGRPKCRELRLIGEWSRGIDSGGKSLKSMKRTQVSIS